ncbi:undecaprenyl-phosphate glucose phosphotransferase [Lichenihabitans psoromatis]|uniref:undecaprenyl-phosphate glucose phosphotransferase n=1 Tax=Lichenihabitans psoromatis TaxID=2528642 RepID=UPI0010385ADE|nr:undecaprenyl-phosphate glucose phosphotransferase [Lichenihabitans psoromatis]
MTSPPGGFTPDDIRRSKSLDPMGQAARPSTRPPSPRLVALAEAMGGPQSRPPYSPVVLAGVVRMVEFVLLCAVGFLIHEVYVAPLSDSSVAYVAMILIVGALSIIGFQAVHANSVTAFRAPVTFGLRVAAVWTFVFLAALAAIFFLKLEGTFSRVWLLSWYGIGLAALLLERGAISMVMRHMSRIGRLDRRTVIVGGGAPAESLLTAFGDQSETDVRIIGVFDDRDDDRSPDVVAGYPKLGNIDDLVEFARHTRLDLVIFTLPITAEQRLLQMLRKLWVLPIDIRLAAHINKLRFRPRSYSYIGSVPVLDVFDKPIADWDVVSKWVFDRLVGALALLVLSPVLLVIAIAVKLDSKGPVLFKQKRHGFNNEIIEVFKFRSMYVDQLDYVVSKQVTRGDPRVTRVGRFIRRTSLDELPQLFNVVFWGNLSLVGPRPHVVHATAADRAYDEVVDGYFARHRVRPGITGWAQVNGWRGETDTSDKIQRRVEHDLAYIENWSIFFDLYILLITPVALVKAENAY